MDRDLIGRGFRILAEGLAPFVDEHMSGTQPDGSDWLSALQARDRARFGRAHPLSLSDPALLLRVLWAHWNVFDGVLSPVARAYAAELRDVRNRWAHNAAFAESEVRRALETMELLLRQVGAHSPAATLMNLYAADPGRPTGDLDASAGTSAPRRPLSAYETISRVRSSAAGASYPQPSEAAVGARDSDTPSNEADSPAGAHEGGEPQVAEQDVLTPIAGILDVLDNYAFVRTSGYLPGRHDVYVSLAQVRKNRLRKGDHITGAIRQPRVGERRRDKFDALVRLDTVNSSEVADSRDRLEFGKLTPLFPQERLRLETEPQEMTGRIIDLLAPVGKGQRGLVLAPPKAGRTTILQHIARAIAYNHPECHLMVVLVDERPESVTDMQRSVRGEVISSAADRPAEEHIAIAELAFERAKRLVELGYDVVILLDSLSRLAGAYNLVAPASGRLLPGGLDPLSLYPVTSLFTAARNVEGGGSLTVLATSLVGTGSRMDETVAEELGRLATMRLRLNRDIAARRIFPAFDLHVSGTQNEDLLLAAEELALVTRLQAAVRSMDRQQALEFLMHKLGETKSNIEFLLSVAKDS